MLQHVNHDFDANLGWGVTRLFDGVAIFFVLSGMLVWSSAVSLRRVGVGWATFFVNRWLRIAPALYVFALAAPLTLVALQVMPLFGLAHWQSVVWFGSFALLVPNYTPESFRDAAWADINGPLWTIPAEVSFYLAVPLLVWFAQRWGVARCALGLVSVSMIVRLVAPVGGDLPVAIAHHSFLELGPYFAAGMLLSHYGAVIPLRWWIAVMAGTLQSALLVFGPSAALLPVYGPAKPLLLAAPLAYLLLYAGLRLGSPFRRLAGTIGDLSFGVYVWHGLVAAVVTILGWTHGGMAALLVVAGALVVAIGSWWLVERPSLALKRVSMRSTRTPVLVIDT